MKQQYNPDCLNQLLLSDPEIINEIGNKKLREMCEKAGIDVDSCINSVHRLVQQSEAAVQTPNMYDGNVINLPIHRHNQTDETFATNQTSIDELRENGEIPQRTLSCSKTISGSTVLSGKNATVTISPADANTGIVFRRTDLPDTNNQISVTNDSIADATVSLTLSNSEDHPVTVIEHVLGAFAGCEIDNAIIEIDGPEVPILDGSARHWCKLIHEAGIVEQPTARRYVKVHKRIVASRGGGEQVAMLIPSETMSFNLSVRVGALGTQKMSFDLSEEGFVSEIAPARMFIEKSTLDELKALGTVRGWKDFEFHVIDGGNMKMPGGSDFGCKKNLIEGKDLVRHKILDTIGDLYSSAPGYLKAKYIGLNSDHRLNQELIRRLWRTPDAWHYTTTPPSNSVSSPARLHSFGVLNGNPT